MLLGIFVAMVMFGEDREESSDFVDFLEEFRRFEYSTGNLLRIFDTKKDQF